MRIQEEYIVPGLGAIILLSVFGFAASGVSLIYPALLGILGLAAVGTYFLPPAVQVEIRIGIAALGLIILVFYFSYVAFWLSLLAFGAIGAFQIRHSATLNMPPQHTVAWVKTLLGQQGAAGMAGAESDGGDGDGETAQTGAAAGAVAVLQGLGVLQRILRVNVGGIGASVLGLFALLSLFLPWIILTASSGEESASLGFTFSQVAQEFEESGDSALGMLFIVLVALGLLSMASVVVPRVAVVIMSVAGMVMTLLSFIYIFAKISEVTTAFSSSYGISVFTLPHIGFLMTGGCFMLITVLQLIPAANRRKG